MDRQGISEFAPSNPLQGEIDSWIESARRGDKEALGQALALFREYLLLVANDELDPALKAKGGASDVVQETFLRAQRGVEGFRGQTANEWRSWLRCILMRHLANRRRDYGRSAKRRIQREVMLAESGVLEATGTDESPIDNLLRRERESALLNALDRLPAHYREVVMGHQRDRLPFEEIGRRRGISAEAARKLWSRALERLRRELDPIFDPR